MKKTIVFLSLILFSYSYSQPNRISPDSASTTIDITPTLQWNVVDANDSLYHLQVSRSPNYTSFLVNDSTLTDTTLELSTLQYLTKHYWKIRKKNKSDVWTSFSTSWAFSTRDIYVSPTAPTLLTPSDGAVWQSITQTFFWNNVATAGYFRLQISPVNNFSNIVVDSTTVDTTTDVGGLSRLTKYYWRVRGETIESVGDWSNLKSFTTLPDSARTVVLSYPNNRETRIDTALTLEWFKVASDSSFYVQVDDNSSFASPVVNDSTTNDIYTKTGLARSKTYYWRVKAKNSVNESDWSTTRRFTTKSSNIE